LRDRVTKKMALSTVVSPVPPAVGLANVDAATPWKKKRKRKTRSRIWNAVLLLKCRCFYV
jgi:hypothetical protein